MSGVYQGNGLLRQNSRGSRRRHVRGQGAPDDVVGPAGKVRMASPRRRVPDTHRRPAQAARVDDSPGWVAGRPGAARPSGRIGAGVIGNAPAGTKGASSCRPNRVVRRAPTAPKRIGNVLVAKAAPAEPTPGRPGRGAWSTPTSKNVLHDLGVGSQPRYEIRPEAGSPIQWNTWVGTCRTGCSSSSRGYWTAICLAHPGRLVV